jgi:menaquinol-cytochrome c reductase iron-sulfur subunit
MMGRRTLIKWLLAVAGAGLGMVVAVPAVISALSPLRRRQQDWRAVGPLREFEIGKVAKATVVPPPGHYPRAHPPPRAVYVSMKNADQAVVFSSTCTDLGCGVNFDPGSEFFYCPCHGGIFNKAGEPVAGPPPRPLYQYATRIRDGVLEIDLASVPIVA